MLKRLLLSTSATVILVTAAIFFVFYMDSGIFEAGITGGDASLDIVSINCVSPVSVNNAQWQVSILVKNPGKTPFLVQSVYVNEKQVDHYGLVHGDSLVDGSIIGTSVDDGGLKLDPNTSYNIYVWIGDKLFSHGTNIVIHFNNPNSITMIKSITLP
jgi:hypothetical protein